MTVNAPEAPATPEPEAPETPAAQGVTPERLPDDHPVVKALAKANKEAEQARLKVKEYEDRDLSEQDRLSKRSAELETKLTTAEATAARFEIALEKGLTKSQAKRLVGNTREELEADADELIADLGAKPAEPVVPVTRRQGGDGGAPKQSPEEIADAVEKRRRGF